MNRNIQAKAEKDIQYKLESTPLRHSQLAMSAARRMPRARKKERVGRVVCHHLLQMLASETPVAVNQSEFELAPNPSPDSRSPAERVNSLQDRLSIVPNRVLSQQEKQFSLSI